MIPSSVIEIFRHEIALKHQTITKGLLSEEAENALNYYITLMRMERKQQHNTDSQQTKIFDLVELRKKIFNYMIDAGLWEEPMQYIHEKYLKQAISAIRGIDARTIDGWIKKLKHGGIIEQSGVHQYMFCNLEGEELLPTGEQQYKSKPMPMRDELIIPEVNK
jgi:hypothetical protein